MLHAHPPFSPSHSCQLARPPAVAKPLPTYPCPPAPPALSYPALQTVQEHLHLEQVVARIDAGVPEDAPPAERLAWLWQCHLRFWACRCAIQLAGQPAREPASESASQRSCYECCR